MTDELVLKLSGPGSYALARSAVTRAREGWVVEIRAPRRTVDQNARLHAMLGDLVKGGFEHFGRKFDVDDLKTLFVSAWMLETGKGSDIVPGLGGGEYVQLRRSTAKMSKEELGELMIIIERTAAERGIQLRDAANPSEGTGT